MLSIGAGAKSTATITGAGSTFVSPLVSLWAADYASKTGTQIAYSPVGSGAGIAAITARQVDFGASDAPLSPDQFTACNGCVQIPWALSATSIIYNLSGVPNNLHMTGAVLARIYLGQITKWNDPAIKALNPKVSLPSTSITPVYRSDNSGTTYNFTDYLSAVSPAWKSKIGVGRECATGPRARAARAAPASRASSRTRRARSATSDVAFALKNRLKFMSMRNASGKFTTPGLRGITRRGRDREVGAGVRRAAHRQPAEGRSARLPDLHVHVRDPADEDDKAAELRKFVFYAVNPTQGQKLGAEAALRPAAEGRARRVREDARRRSRASTLRSGAADAGALRGARVVR